MHKTVFRLNENDDKVIHVFQILKLQPREFIFSTSWLWAKSSKILQAPGH